jgi:hypothetical protein
MEKILSITRKPWGINYIKMSSKGKIEALQNMCF